MSEKWIKCRFDDHVTDATSKGCKLPQKLFHAQGRFAIVDQGKDFIAGYTDQEFGVYEDIPAIIFGDHTRSLKYVDFPFFLGADGTKILKVDDIDVQYLYYYLDAHPVPNTGYNRHFSWLKKKVIYAPNSPDEQRHIAQVLSTCDEVIAKSERAAEKYRQIKAGMLKDLLTRGIDNRGKMRPPPSVAPELYKDSELGPIPKEWEVKRLGDESVSVINPPACPLPSTFVYIDLESVKGGVLLQENLISREEAPSRAQRNVSDGDILYQLVRPYQMNNLLFRKSSELNYVASTGYALIRAAGDAGYLFQYVHTTEFVNKVLGMCTGTGYPAITPNNLSKILVRVPSLPEQRAIAERLAAVDERIAAEVKTAEKCRKVKAGLMEKLLTPPADAEVEDLTQEVAG